MRWLAVAVGLLLIGCGSKHDTRHDAAPAPPKVVDAAAPPPPPVVKGTYVGSAKCAECHADEVAAWRKSWHAAALQPGAKQVGKPAHFKGPSSEAWIGKGAMKTTGPDGAVAEFSIDYVIGGKRMQDTVHAFPDGRWQVLPIYFHVTKQEWVDYTETKQGALTPEHPFYWTNVRRMANHECLDCHTTGLAVTYADGAWHTTFADMAVACEDCHGPGGKHSATKRIEDILQPKDAPPEIGVAACNRCHGPRKPLWPLLDPDHQFEPVRDGARYDELYEPIVVALPDGLSSDFFADGKPKTSSFEYQALLQSACARKGKVTCLTCHTAPHEAKRPDELRVDRNDSCTGCHPAIAAAPAKHSHHAAKQADCIGCHMPPIVSGVLDQFADHAIDIPNPGNHGVPDACTVCHAKRAPAELAAQMATWWPDIARSRARRTRLADAFDEATARASARPLVEVIDDRDEAPTLRGAAMVIAARRFGPATGPKLAAQLASDSVILRAKACEAIGGAHATAAAELVAAQLARETSVRVRLACALALWDLHDARGEPALQHLADDPATSHLAIPHRELGVAKARRHDYAGARRELDQAVALSPYATDALVELAEIDAELHDFAAARARLDQALALEPHQPRALGLRAKLPAGQP